MVSILPDVSVIIPNYNHAIYLEQRIESVLNQTYSNLEVILLDDNSTDRSIEIIKKYKGHPKVKAIIINENNSGSVFKQWVKGIDLASGKYLWIAESDDYADEKFIEETVSLAKGNEELGFIFTDSYNVNHRGDILGSSSSSHFMLNEISEEKHIFLKKEKATQLFLSHILIPNASAVLFNLDRLKRAVNFSKMQSFYNVGDQFTYLSIYLCYGIGYVNKPLNYRRSHNTNTTSLNFSNGLIYKEQLSFINYFFKNFQELKTSKNAFDYYLRKNFLKATDYFLLSEMKELLKALYRSDLISLKKYIYLSVYIFATRIYGKSIFQLRLLIKKVMLE